MILYPINIYGILYVSFANRDYWVGLVFLLGISQPRNPILSSTYDCGRMYPGIKLVTPFRQETCSTNYTTTRVSVVVVGRGVSSRSANEYFEVGLIFDLHCYLYVLVLVWMYYYCRVVILYNLQYLTIC